ncbi:MAG TPA: glycoside hydrolase domain-containing protein [Chthoniobacteraceae bacterium]|nr:glycoside hydrolase domain-containing protein [Chthoniobacteraceae bacterium]
MNPRNGKVRSSCLALLLLASAAPMAPGNPAKGEPSVYHRKWTKQELQTTLDESEKWVGKNPVRMDYAPPPWTPMSVEGETIRCWGKEYRYDGSILPVQMTTQGVALLKGKPRFLLQADGRKLEFSEAEVAIEKLHDGAVSVKTVSRQDGFTLELDTVYEFDGMGKVTLRLTSDRAARLEALHLEFPLEPSRSALFHHAGARSGVVVKGIPSPGAAFPPLTDSGRVPGEGMFLDVFREVIWLGDQDVGFSWFADGMEGWRIKDEHDIQVVSPARGGKRLFRIKLADRPGPLDEPMELVFGIQATPMRPRPADFRSRVGWSPQQENRRFDFRWRWGDGYYYPFQDTYPQEARKDVEEQRARGMELMPCSSVEYIGAYRFSRGKFGLVDHPGLKHREVLFWGDHWNQVRRYSGDAQEAARQRDLARALRKKRELQGHTMEEVLAIPRHTAEGDNWDGVEWRPTSYPERYCYHSTFQDYYVWKLAELVRHTGLRALYLDQQLYQCSNPEHGCGYLDRNGEWAAQGNVFAMREMMKRIYFVFHRINGVAPEIMFHCSAQMVIPAMSFMDIYWDGEKYVLPGRERSLIGREFYSEFLTEEIMQVQHTGKQFGFTPDFLPQITRSELNRLKVTSPTLATARDMMGLLLVHDSHVDAYQALTYHGALVSRILNRRAAYPLEKMETIYYWEKGRGIKVEQEAVKPIFHYDRDQGLLILFNWSDETLLARVKLDPGKLGVEIGEGGVRDALTGEKLDTGLNDLAIDLLPRDFRMIELDWRAGSR